METFLSSSFFSFCIFSISSSSTTSSASSHIQYSILALEKEKLRALLKSSHHEKSYNLSVYFFATCFVLSALPVSTMMISSANFFTQSKHLANTSSSFFTIIHTLMLINDIHPLSLKEKDSFPSFHCALVIDIIRTNVSDK